MTYDRVKAQFMKHHRLSYVRVIMQEIGSHNGLVCQSATRGDDLEATQSSL
jgi:hypothetical protein